MYSTTFAGFPASPTTTQSDIPDPTQSVNPACPDPACPDTGRPDAAASPVGSDVTGQDRLQELPDVIEFCKTHGFPADVVGRWVWIRFDEKPDADTRGLLKAAGFRWVRARGQWAHNCGYHSRKGKGNPRWKYGSVPVSEISRDDIASLKGAAA